MSLAISVSTRRFGQVEVIESYVIRLAVVVVHLLTLNCLDTGEVTG